MALHACVAVLSHVVYHCLIPCTAYLFLFGRYATSYDGVLIVDDSSLIHDFYTGECARPVHLVLDTALKVTGSFLGPF